MSTQSWTLALSAAALVLGACHQQKESTVTPGNTPAAAAKATKIKCFGINSCAGQSACDVPDGRVAPGSKGHACAGQNECSGKGWILLTDAECGQKGGQPL